MWVTIVMGNKNLYFIWKILKILKKFKRMIYLISLLDSGENYSNEKGNEYFSEGGEK